MRGDDALISGNAVGGRWRILIATRSSFPGVVLGMIYIGTRTVGHMYPGRGGYSDDCLR